MDFFNLTKSLYLLILYIINQFEAFFSWCLWNNTRGLRRPEARICPGQPSAPSKVSSHCCGQRATEASFSTKCLLKTHILWPVQAPLCNLSVDGSYWKAESSLVGFYGPRPCQHPYFFLLPTKKSVSDTLGLVAYWKILCAFEILFH